MILLVVFGVESLSRQFFLTQDLWVSCFYVAVLTALGLGLIRGFGALPAPRLSFAGTTAAAAALVLLLWLGTYVVFANYALTRDEHMVLFDMAVFREGRLAAPLAQQWREFTQALVPAFLLDLPGNAALVSAYMPANAALRTGFSMLGDPALLNPLLAGAGAVALFDICRRLLPESRGGQATALLLYFSSAQMLAAAMTPYSMTGHLAFNLVWLALFLRGDKLGHAGAILIGFVATGLHQVIFHPLFVLPFIPLLWVRGERRTAILYVVAYALIGLFWISWPQLVALSAGLAGTQAAGGAGGFFQERILPLLLNRDPHMLALMGHNLVRFFSWQNLALIPLLMVGLRALPSADGVMQALWRGILLTIVAMAILLPYQGHGWGYRYLHGLLGSFVILAAFGWVRLEERGAEARRLLAVGTAATLVALPFLLVQAHAFATPYAELDRLVGSAKADFVIVDTESPDWAVDVVRNDPWLRNRPLRFSSRDLDPEAVHLLCGRGTIAFIGGEHVALVGLNRGEAADGATFAMLKQRLARRPCLEIDQTGSSSSGS
jgi:hypothetical protein